MRHYSREEWVEYCDVRYEDATEAQRVKFAKMGDHIVYCSKCRKLYGEVFDSLPHDPAPPMSAALQEAIRAREAGEPYEPPPGQWQPAPWWMNFFRHPFAFIAHVFRRLLRR